MLFKYRNIFYNIKRQSQNAHIDLRNLHTKGSLCRNSTLEDLDISEIDEKDSNYQELSSRFLGLDKVHNCFIIHPHIKWGPQKQMLSTPQDELEEAESLIRTLDPWKVEDKIIISLTNLEKKTVFGSGNLEKLKNMIRNSNATAVFLNMSTLKIMQIEELQRQFGVAIFDRYKIVMEILRLHAISKHAKLQVALAELQYITYRLLLDSDGSLLNVGNNREKRKLLLHERENKLKAAIKKLRAQREMTRNRRKILEFPTVAVVGYTNCGKTSLIKALTHDKNLQPRNQLFATLDVTLHAGMLPSKLEVLYVDTVGFISNIPTSLIECFVATLEDALFATVILHVEDISSRSRLHKKKNVLDTLNNLLGKSETHQLNRFITVGNKCDLVTEKDNLSDIIPVSAKTGQGLDFLLEKLEAAILAESNRKIVTFKVPFGSNEIRWLYKNATVTNEMHDLNNSEYENATVIITEAKYNQFKKLFGKTIKNTN